MKTMKIMMRDRVIIIITLYEIKCHSPFNLPPIFDLRNSASTGSIGVSAWVDNYNEHFDKILNSH